MRKNVWLLLFFILTETTNSKYMEGEINTGENWAFLARFCFLSLQGKFQYEIEYPEEYAIQNLDLYYDTDSQWPLVYGSSSNLTSCREKESVLQVENNQFINLTTDVIYSGCSRHSYRLMNSTYFYCKGSRNFRTARERWWYIAISNCQSAKGLKLRYKLWFTNGNVSDFFFFHFSADEFYILHILLVYNCLNAIMVIITLRNAYELRSRQLLHSTYKLFMTSLLLQIACLVLQTIAYIAYAIDGYGLPVTKLIGRITGAISEILFLLLLILLAKGYTVSRARLRQYSTIKITVFICAYLLCYMALFFIEQLYFDPGKVLYLYESIWGYLIVVLRLVGWVMFIYATFFTLKHYPEKGGFYYPFFSFYTMWFISGPVVIIIGNMYIAKWVREKVVFGIVHGIAFIGHFVFLVLTRPSAHNKNFPYHVRTTQIGIMEALSANTVVGNHTLDGFGHHGYGVNPVHSRNYDIFTVDPPPGSTVSWGRGAVARPSSYPRTMNQVAQPVPPILLQTSSLNKEVALPGSEPQPEAASPKPEDEAHAGNKDVYDPNAADELQEWSERNI